MMKRWSVFLTMLSGALCGAAQHDAALQRLMLRYPPEQIADLREHGHYKYAGLLLFYSASFLVEHEGGFRVPTEEEILAIDLHAHDAARSPDEDAVVEDALLGRRVKLLSRRAFEQLVLDRLSAEDRAAYLAYRSAALAPADHKTLDP